MENDVICAAVNVKKYFAARMRSRLFGKRRYVHAVDGVSFEISKGETFGLVGESGCGKTTLANLVMRLEQFDSGDIIIKGKALSTLNRKQRNELCRQVQMIFQDPYTSLSPLKDISYSLREPLAIHNLYDNGRTRMEKVREMLETVGLPTSEDFLEKRPMELSGGQQQRVGFARALLLEPDFMVCDEPVSMLDASLKAEIIALLMKLKQEKELTYLFITHELGVAYAICDRIAVMYTGKLVELGTADNIVNEPLHPYSQLLLEAIPPLHPDPKWASNILEGEVPHFIEPPSGCRFHPRCRYAKNICKVEEPDLKEVVPGHYVACYEVL
ncbi:ABC transporter ATP-binding protein [Chloroflexota bacterium]